MKEINLDRKTFIIKKNDGEDAQLTPGSIFHFRQAGTKVTADYMGAKVPKGHLEGEIRDNKLYHHYEQYDRDGNRYAGNAVVKIIKKEDGKLELLDEWEWESQVGKGSCLMEEVS